MLTVEWSQKSFEVTKQSRKFWRNCLHACFWIILNPVVTTITLSSTKLNCTEKFTASVGDRQKFSEIFQTASFQHVDLFHYVNFHLQNNAFRIIWNLDFCWNCFYPSYSMWINVLCKPFEGSKPGFRNNFKISFTTFVLKIYFSCIALCHSKTG